MRVCSIILAAALLPVTAAVARQPKAFPVCVVADPTGTPLNLRVSPGGRIIGTLRNGVRVTYTDTSLENGGDTVEWVQVQRLAPRRVEPVGRPLGWVTVAYLRCR